MVIAAMSVRTEELHPKKRNSTAHDFEERLKRKVVGQGEAVQAIVDLNQVSCAPPKTLPVGQPKPVASGPTGTGKTRGLDSFWAEFRSSAKNRQMITT
jgi:ATP-dependent Clp protease ATP-binding subunit ClpA